MEEYLHSTPEDVQNSVSVWENTPHDTGGGGGGGGTDNYNALTNRPQINGVTLEGNKTLVQLGAASTGALAQVQSDAADALTKATTAQSVATNAATVANTAKTTAEGADSKADSALTAVAAKADTTTVTALESRVTAAESDISTKADTTAVTALEDRITAVTDTIGDPSDLSPSSDTLVEAINKAYNHGGGGDGGTSDYAELENKPKINGVTLNGNKTGEDFELADLTVTNALDSRVTALENNPVNPIQFDVMPTASADYNVVQYTGTTAGVYTRGYFYRSTPSVVEGELQYNWVRIDVQPGAASLSINGVELVGDKTSSDLHLADVFQYGTLPTADATNVGKVVQYVGATTAEYTQGWFYQSVYDTESAGYKWVYKPVSSDPTARVAQLEANQGDITEVAPYTTLVSAIRAVGAHTVSSFTYTEPNLIITYEDGSTVACNLLSVLNETQIGELADVLDSTISDTNILQYDSSLRKYKPMDIVARLTSLLADAKAYTDTKVSESVVAGAYVCDTKPEYDAENDTVIYKQDGVTKTTTQTDARFYYHDSQDNSFCSSWINDVEFTFSVAEVSFADYVRVENVVSTYTGEETDKTKVPNLSALDALMTLVNNRLGDYVASADIVDTLVSQDASKVLSANQGYVLAGRVATKQDIMQYSSLPTASAALLNKVVQIVPTGNFYRCVVDDELLGTYKWEQIKFAADTDTVLSTVSTNPVTNSAITTALNTKQTSILSTPIEVDGVEQTTVEGALGAINGKTVDVDTTLDDTSNNPIANAPVATAIDTLTSLVGQKPTIVAALPVVDAGVVVLATDGLVYLWDDTEGEYRVADYPDPDLSKYRKQFNGTLSEWNALTTAQQNEYDSAGIDDMAGAGSMLTGVVEEGNENAVTSDAVYKAMKLDKDGSLTVTTTAALTAGTVLAYRRGNVVVVVLRGVSATYGTSDTAIVTGLPGATGYYYYPALVIQTEEKRSLIMEPSGELKIGLGSVDNLWQTIMYLTDE